MAGAVALLAAGLATGEASNDFDLYVRSPITGQTTWQEKAGAYAEKEREISLHSLFHNTRRQGKLTYGFSLMALQQAERRSSYISAISRNTEGNDSNIGDPSRIEQTNGSGSEEPQEMVGGSQPEIRYSSPEIQATVCQAEFTWPCEWAIAVVLCESSGNWSVIGQEWYNGELWYFIGGWQIAVKAVDYNSDPEAYAYLFDPYLNTIEAHVKFVGGGVGHWPNCG